MKCRLYFSILLLCTMAFGCATTSEFTAYKMNKDKFEPNKTHYYSSPIPIKGTKMISFTWATFTIHYIQSSVRNWIIHTIYTGDDWLFIDEIKFIIDGKIYSFESLPNPTREVTNVLSVRVMEGNDFLISGELLGAIKSAKEVSVRLSGKGMNYDKDLTPEEIHNIGWFYNYVRTELEKKQ